MGQIHRHAYSGGGGGGGDLTSIFNLCTNFPQMLTHKRGLGTRQLPPPPLLTLRKVAMSIKYNTKWPFDLITCRVRCTIITQWSGNDIPVNLFCSCIFIFYKTSVFAMKNTVLIVLLVTYNEAFLKSGVHLINKLLCFQNIFAIRKLI